MSARDRRDGRGQTTIDFAIGASLFLIVAAFIFAFVPGMFVPFLDTDRPQAADRVATDLATNTLTTPASPYVLNATCTEAFFDGGAVPSGCRFESGSSLNEMLGVIDYVELNVTVERLDGGVASIDGGDDDDTASELRAGQSLPGGRDVTSTRRIVRIAETSYRLNVRVW